MNKFAFYAAYHNGTLARKFLAELPLDKSASETPYLTPDQFSTMVEKTSGEFMDALKNAWKDFSTKYKDDSTFRTGVNTVGGAVVGGLGGGLASKLMGHGFLPGALIGGGLGGLGGYKFGDKIVSGAQSMFAPKPLAAPVPNALSKAPQPMGTFEVPQIMNNQNVADEALKNMNQPLSPVTGTSPSEREEFAAEMNKTQAEALSPVTGTAPSERKAVAADLGATARANAATAGKANAAQNAATNNLLDQEIKRSGIPQPVKPVAPAAVPGMKKIQAENPWVRQRPSFKYSQGRDKTAAQIPIAPPQQQQPISTEQGATPLSEPIHNGPLMQAKAGMPIVKAQSDKSIKEAEAEQAKADAHAAGIRVGTETRKMEAKKKITDAKLAMKAIEPVKPQGPGQAAGAAPGQMPGTQAMVQ